MAERAISLVDLRISRAVDVLNEVANRGIDSCQPHDLELLRQAVFRGGAIKELSLIGSGGQTL
jgi:hypothetical protein